MPSKKTAERLYVSPVTVAGWLSLSKTHVYNMIRSGELPAARIGRAVRIPVAALREKGFIIPNNTIEKHREEAHQ